MAKSKKQPRGIVMIAGGNSQYYGNCAVNLCASLRYKDKDIPITIFEHNNAIPLHRRTMLQYAMKVDIQQLSEEACTDKTGRVNYYKAKTRIYDLSPYEHTLYLDADTLWLPSITPSAFFDKWESKDFDIINEGHYDLLTGEDHTTGFYTFWGDADTMLKRLGGTPKGDRLYQMRSELIYFKKTPANRVFFNKVKAVYDGPLTTMSLIGDKLPDEYAFNMAGLYTGVKPATEKWYPMYWHFKHVLVHKRQLDRFAIMTDYMAYSVGGNKLNEVQKRFYNERVLGYFSVQGFATPWKIVNKKDVLPDRVKL